MGNVGKKLKRWKWPLGAAGAILVAIGLNTVKASPEFAAAQAVGDNANNNNVQQSTDIGQSQDGADQWVERRGRHGMRGQQGGGFNGGGMDGGFSGDRNGGSVNEGGGGGFRSSTRTS
ncbi:DUF4179 domain-containing protein [Paenibacillus sp. PR3]|uniref:DUF4179 domain-containing protein n=1 Tax=Paenibacillus terricola TaxID=2763503 RepID=A0ABR8MPD0_9BACL|nr:DUF4179 domain-containing protein [Paenibacillus terricola]MBD3917847.1 DUF4179 domain-containing protein [Paenibacillus terricola]